MLLQFIKHSVSRIAVEVYDNEGLLLQQRLLNRYVEKDVRWLANVSQWDIPHTNTTLQQFCEQEDTDRDVYEFEPPTELLESWQNNSRPGQTSTNETNSTSGNPSTVQTSTDSDSPPCPPFLLHVRELTQLKKYGKSYSNVDVCTVLREAFDDVTVPWVEPIIEWVDRESLCCLDIDYHTSTPPSSEELYTLVSVISPQPYCWHPSHGGGAKLYYVGQPRYSAVELAAVAGMQWVEHSPRATFDLIKSTRHPSYPRTRDNKPPPCSRDEIQYTYGAGDVSSLKRLLSDELDSPDVEEFLATRGWNIGETRPHTDCPINPTDGDKQCVYVGDKGIFCHRCQAKGLGGRTPGFVSYASMIGGSDNRIRSMVKNFVHLDHAKVVLQNLYPCIPEIVLESIYKVMLKIVHNPDDPRIGMAMNAGKGFLRIKGQWVTTDGETSLTEGLAGYVKSLPVTLVPRGDAWGVSIPVMTTLLNHGEASQYGYHDISFIRGCKVYGQFLPYPRQETVKVITRREFANCPPRYIPPDQRMDMEDAWGLIESIFPGINRTYVKLLIAAKGASEGRLAQCPFLMITGVSSAGKSTTVHIAAGICGDKADEPIFNGDVLRLRASLMDAAKSSGFVCVNEIFKMAEHAKLSYTQALDPMLSLTEDSRSHVLYVGSIPFGRLPVFVLTDINCPSEILADYQIARRFTFFRLNSEIEWNTTLVDNHIRPHEIRLISPEHALAADCILSDVIDEFFKEPIPLSAIAERLGISTTRQTTIVDEEPEDNMYDRSEIKKKLRRFYQMVCQAPMLTAASDLARYTPAKGWKKIDRLIPSAILDLWSELCDGQQGTPWTRSRAIDAEDWRKLLRLPCEVVCDVRAYMLRTLYVRFRSADSAKRPSWINGEFVSKPE